MDLPSTIFLLNIVIGNFEISIQLSGGAKIPAGFFPYHVSIMRLGENICNGGIIDRTHVLTAASCVSSFQESAFAVIAGRMDLIDSIPQWRGVRKIHLHPNFSIHYSCHDSEKQIPYVSQKNNIAVLTLVHPFTWTERVLPMVLGFKNSQNINFSQSCAITGLGWVKEPTPIGTHLTFILVYVLSFEESVSRHTMLEINEFAVEDRRKKMVSSPKDYGTLLLCHDSIIGILIYTMSSPFYPSVFLAVAPYLEFINQAINN